MNNIYYGTGKRKTASSRVFMKLGSGNIIINKIEFNEYIKNEFKKNIILNPLNLTNLYGKFDLYITVKGGGVSSQISSIAYGISKAILKYDLNHKTILKKNKYTTRDSRKVERKKVGFKKARKKPQFSKR